MKRSRLLFYFLCLFSTAWSNERSLSFVFDRFPVSNQVPSHQITLIEEEKKGIKLSDGSQWIVSLFDRYKLDQWSEKHHVFITQNPRWFSSFRYRLVNQDIGTAVEASLNTESQNLELATIKISHVDLQTKTVELTDGSVWEVSATDTEILEQWNKTDPLIAGFNSGTEHQAYDGILIHLQSNHCVQARKL